MKTRLIITFLWISMTCLSATKPFFLRKGKKIYRAYEVNLNFRPTLKGAVKLFVEKEYSIKNKKDSLERKRLLRNTVEFYNKDGSGIAYCFYGECELKRSVTCDENKRPTLVAYRTDKGKLLGKVNYAYNDQGVLTLETVQQYTFQGDFKAKRSYAYRYHENGGLRALFKFKYNSSGRASRKYIYVYNDKKQRIGRAQFYFNTRAKLWYKEIYMYAYDEKGKLDRKSEYTGYSGPVCNDSTDMEREMRWIEMGYYITEKNLAKKTKVVPQKKEFKTYDKQGRVIGNTVYKCLGSFDKQTWCYDKKGRLHRETEAQYIDKNQLDREIQWVYTYQNPELLITKRTIFYNTDGSLWYTKVETFNERKKITSMRTYSSDHKLINGCDYGYKYDEKGNCIEETKSFQGVLEKLTTRQIVYYN
jgi:hypothetical protein